MRDGLQKMENDKVIDGNCWVAYFDILGFSNMVRSFPVEYVKEEYKKAIKKGEEYHVNCRFMFFSDSFIFYTENDSHNSYCGISAASELFFEAMFLKEIPMRGCLNVGQFYADEENGIFFGQALIKAYHLAEGQNWIGFVLSETARKKSVVFKANKDFWYLEYEVPYIEEPKHRKLLAYYPNILIMQSFPEPANHQQTRLLGALDTMELKAQLIYRKDNKLVDKAKDPDFIRLMSKYRNTREFFTKAYPLLRNRFEQKYPIPRRSDLNEV